MLTTSQVCAVALAAANAYVSARMSQTISTYLSLITFAVFANYAYRDGWPLMTFTLRPRDESEGTLLWVKVGLAAWAGVLGPLLEPYPYIPLNRKVGLCSVSRVPCVYSGIQGQVFSANPEQTASILSWVFWTFIDPTIWRAYTLPHLSHDQLPPLADYDDAGYLIEQHLHVCMLSLQSRIVANSIIPPGTGSFLGSEAREHALGHYQSLARPADVPSRLHGDSGMYLRFGNYESAYTHSKS